MKTKILFVISILFVANFSACGPEDDGSDAICTLVVQCDPGQIQVGQCSDPMTCDERDLSCLGPGSIFCEPDPVCADKKLECEEGYTRGDICENQGSDECIRKGDDCNPTFFCNPDPVAACLAFPACDQDQFEVQTCMLTDDACEAVTICEQTIFCTALLDCEAAASCEADEITYASKAECDAANQNCRQAYRCSDTVWCGGNSTCQAPNCGNKTPNPDCDDPQMCTEVIGCGRRVVCGN